MGVWLDSSSSEFGPLVVSCEISGSIMFWIARWLSASQRLCSMELVMDIRMTCSIRPTKQWVLNVQDSLNSARAITRIDGEVHLIRSRIHLGRGTNHTGRTGRYRNLDCKTTTSLPASCISLIPATLMENESWAGERFPLLTIYWNVLMMLRLNHKNPVTRFHTYCCSVRK
jgi:hypothetical protein